MDTQKIKQLIQEIPDWRTKSPEILLAELSEQKLLFQDNSDWTWKGISRVFIPENNTVFGRDGCKKLQDALKSAGEELWISQISVGMPLTDPEIQQTLRYLDALGIVPGARYVANAVHRMISILEQNGIHPTETDIKEAKACLLLEEQKQQLITENTNRWNQFCNAVNSWDGTEPRPEL